MDNKDIFKFTDDLDISQDHKILDMHSIQNVSPCIASFQIDGRGHIQDVR